MAIDIFNFKSFLNVPDGDLKGELIPAEVNSYGTQRILRMKHFIPDQPNFFISRESWELLFAGKTISDGAEKTWILKGYEVYGFVFCIATHKNIKNQKKITERAYFRVRTIIKEISKVDSIGKSEILVLVETDNISFVNLSKALRNNRIPTTSPLENCLEFIAIGDILTIIGSFGKPLKEEIDLEVKAWKDEQQKRKSLIKFIDIKKNKIVVPIEQ